MLDRVMKMKDVKHEKLVYLVSIALAFGVGGLSAWVNAGKFDTPELARPPLSPPMWVFGLVWGILFLLMGISAARVYLRGGPESHDALFLYATQLVVNFLWTVFYFSFGALLLSFFWLLFLLAVVVLMAVRFERACPGAGKLQIPYCLWLAFAAYLNFATWWLNRA